MIDLYDKIVESVSFIREQYSGEFPEIAIMTGTGLGGIVDAMEIEKTIPYSSIPNFPKSTVTSHKGELIVGKIEGVKAIILAGRWHYYEGYSTKEFTLPIRILKFLGLKEIIFTNVSGGINPSYKAGDIVILKDHINLIPDHPLRGPNDDRLGDRFPDMMHTYNQEARTKLLEIANRFSLPIHEGVYLALQGPSLETPSEYAFVYKVGGDLVGMSTVPEVIVAKHSGLKISALSIVSNECYPLDRLTETTVEEVVAIGNKAGVKLTQLIKSYLVER